jgi:hypothetical protein
VTNQRSEIGELSQSAWEPKIIESKESAKENSEDRWTSQVASSRRRYAKAIVVIGNVIVKDSSNKPASFKPQPINYLSRKPGHVTSWCQKYLNTLQYSENFQSFLYCTVFVDYCT